MAKKKRKHAKGKKRRRVDRERQVLLQKAGLAAAVLLIVVLAVVCVKHIIRDNNAEETVANETESAWEESTQADVETASPEADGETEEIVIAAEIGDMDDEEDQQAIEDDREAEVLTEDVLEHNDFDRTGVSLGIDVAKWQGTIDWQQVKDAGVEFAVIRLGYRTMKTGVIYEDPNARYNLQQAQAAGIKLGAYFFSTAVNEQEAKEEAAWVCNFVARYPMTYPIAYNCEGFKSPQNRQYELTQAERTNLAVVFMDYIAAKGYTPMFYASRNEMEGSALWDMDRLEGKYMIWVSQYPDVPYPDTEKPDYTGVYDMWQYTSQGIVPGVPKGADMNVAYFGYSQIAQPRDDTPPEAAEADPEALINFTEVDETVTAKIETNMRSVPSTADDNTIVARLKNGETVQRTGIGHNGWSRIIYNGQKLYAVSSYLTTDLNSVPDKTEEAEQDIDSAEQAGEKSDMTGESEKETDTAQDQAQTQESPASGDLIYTAVNEPVTAKNTTNLRSSADSSDPGNIVGTLKYGEVAVRVGVGSNGWSQLSYNGQIVYAISSYLTTDGNYKENNTPSLANPEAGITFTPVNEQVTAKIETNLRNLPTTLEPSSVMATLKNGEVATRTGVGSNGWSRLSYNGQTVYAVTSYLTTVE